MIKDNNEPQDIGERSFDFSLRVLRFVESLTNNKTNTILSSQLIRSATSIGANIEEARGGHTKNDFSHSMNVSKKEARETLYWLRLLCQYNNFPERRTKHILQEAEEIVKILTTIVKSAKPRLIVKD